MPRGDGTGPMGMGPMSGRAFNAPGYMHTGFGRGFGYGYGWGRGLGRGRAWGYPMGAPWYGYPAVLFGGPVDARTEAQGLREHEEMLQKELEAVRERLSQLENEEGK